MARADPPSRSSPLRPKTTASRAVAAPLDAVVEQLRNRRAGDATTAPRVLLVGGADAAQGAAQQVAAALKSSLETLDLAALNQDTVAGAEHRIDERIAAVEQRGALLFVPRADALFGQAPAEEPPGDGVRLMRHAYDHFGGGIILAVAQRPEAEQLQAGRLTSVIELAAAAPVPEASAGGTPMLRPRNFHLIRAILFDAERQVPQLRTGDFTFAGADQPAIVAHAELLIEAGFLKGRIVRSSSQPEMALIEGLTWQGHDLVALLRSEPQWQQATRLLDAAGRADSAALLQHLRQAKL